VIALFDALGRRKALRLVWELRGKRSLNFRQLAEACEVSPSVLNTRLRELRDLGLVEHEALAGYSLTKRGNELFAHLLPLYKWSRGWMSKG
jgi:DNA-binding HxlR family transcriptional regulator